MMALGGRRVIWLAVILALAGIALVAFTGAEAAGQGEPQCGDTITADTTLHHDLMNCFENGIVIGADGITLDLNGHVIDGDEKSSAACDCGVFDDGHDGVTVKNGSVHEFDQGIFVGSPKKASPASHNRVLDISSSRNRRVGLTFFHSTQSLVRNSSGSGSITRDGGTGIFLIFSHHVRVLGSSFRNNGQLGMGAIESTHNLIKGNLTARNRESGIRLEGSNRTQVRRNRSVRDGEGILVTAPEGSSFPSNGSNQDVIARNRVLRVGRKGHGAGIRIEKGRGNLVAHNLIVRGAPQDGVHVTRGAKHTLLRGNRARHTTDDGFDVKGHHTKLTKNRALHNGDLGIEAVRGVIDGDGNIARHNGDPRQCLHIACK